MKERDRYEVVLDLSAISSKSASLRPSSLYLQRRVPRSTSNPDLPSPTLSPEDELSLNTAAAGSVLDSPIGEAMKTNHQRKVRRRRRVQSLADLAFVCFERERKMILLLIIIFGISACSFV